MYQATSYVRPMCDGMTTDQIGRLAFGVAEAAMSRRPDVYATQSDMIDDIRRIIGLSGSERLGAATHAALMGGYQSRSDMLNSVVWIFAAEDTSAGRFGRPIPREGALDRLERVLIGAEKFGLGRDHVANIVRAMADPVPRD